MAAPEYLGEAPAPGTARPLAAGVHWVRLPVPGALGHINVWLLEDGGGFLLVDTGMDIPQARAAWQGALTDYLGGRPVTRILCTHHHPDHAGLAAWLQARFGAEVLMSAGEYALLGQLAGPAADAAADARRVAGFARDGLEADAANRTALSGAAYRGVVSGVPAGVREVRDGERLVVGGRAWTARVVGGHTDAQLVLHQPDAGLLIAGDQVLPRITSNVGIYPERSDPDPVSTFLASFARLEAMEPEPVVLPSHGEVFRGLRARLGALRAHHAATLERVRELVREPCSARELAAQLYRRPLEGLNLMLGVGEALAHLEHLARAGVLERLEPPGGLRRYRPAA